MIPSMFVLICERESDLRPCITVASYDKKKFMSIIDNFFPTCVSL